MKAIIIDDEPLALEKLRSYVRKLDFLELAGEFTSGVDASDFLADNDVDLIVTDINMPDLNGIDLVKALDGDSAVIFTTAHADFAVESYKVSAADYLLKPFTFRDFEKAVLKARSMMGRSASESVAEPVRRQPRETIFIKVDSAYVPLNIARIRYIKGFGEYIRVYVADREHPYVTHCAMNRIIGSLPGNFMQLHRSYIVNLNLVMQLERTRVLLDKDNYVVVTGRFRKNYQDFLDSLTLGRK